MMRLGCKVKGIDLWVAEYTEVCQAWSTFTLTHDHENPLHLTAVLKMNFLHLASNSFKNWPRCYRFYLFIFYLFVLICNINLNHKVLLESVFLVLICKKQESALVFSNHRVKEGLSLWDMLLIIPTQPPITMSGLQTTLSWTISFILPFKLNVQQFVLNSFPVYWKCLRLLAT